MKKSFLLVAAILFTIAAVAQDAAELIKKANEAFKANLYAEAFDLFDKAMSNLGTVEVDKAINFNIAYSAMQAEKNEAAIKYFDKAIEAGTNVPKCYEFKALVYNRLKDLPNALLSYEKALEAVPEKPGPLLVNAANTAFRLENYEKALSYYDKAYEAGYKPEDVLFNKAMTYKKMNNNDAFKQTLITGNEKFPENRKFASALAAIYLGEGNALYKGGLDILNAVNAKVNSKKLKTDDPAYKAEVEKVNAEFAKAVEVLNTSLKLDPANPNTQKLIDACKPVK